LDWLVYVGAVLAFAGLAGLCLCIWRVLRARRAAIPDAEMRALLQRVVAVNLAALMLSALGLMAIVIGLLLGG